MVGSGVTVVEFVSCGVEGLVWGSLWRVGEMMGKFEYSGKIVFNDFLNFTYTDSECAVHL